MGAAIAPLDNEFEYFNNGTAVRARCRHCLMEIDAVDIKRHKARCPERFAVKSVTKRSSAGLRISIHTIVLDFCWRAQSGHYRRAD